MDRIREAAGDGTLAGVELTQAIDNLNENFADSSTVFKVSLDTYDATMGAFTDATKTNADLNLDYALEVDEASSLILDAALKAEEAKDSLLDSIRNLFGGAYNVFESAFDMFGLKIPGFANGGIVTKPTLAMVGESGPEAIVPLSGIGGMGAPTEVNIYINAPISNSNDAQSLVDEVVTRLKREMSMQTFL